MACELFRECFLLDWRTGFDRASRLGAREGVLEFFLAWIVCLLLLLDVWHIL